MVFALPSLSPHHHTTSSKMADAGLQMGGDAAIKDSVSRYYGETLQSTGDLKTSACCTAKAPPKDVLAVLRQVPAEITDRYYGCGSPFPAGLKGSGLRVLDLGCGTGRDCYVCAALVGEQGSVTGIDMTDAQLEVATKHSAAWQQHLGYSKPNMRFVKGAIEQLDAAGVPPGSVDVIISNCVVNLSPDKPAVLRQAYAALAEGGEVYFSDVYCDRRLPSEVRRHEVLLGECLGGALHVNDFVRLCHEVGFADPRVLDAAPIEVHDSQLKALLGDAAFYSVTFRLFKLPPGQLEAAPAEDYGQSVTYKGDLPGAPDSYTLDSQHTFAAGVLVRVSGNTAALCTSSWLRRHFTLAGDRTQHLGQFGAAAAAAAAVDARSIAALAAGTGAGGCCPPAAKAAAAPSGGGCCPPAAKTAAAPSGGGCCPPAAKAAAPAATNGGGCCAPKPAGGCCPPSSNGAATAAAVPQQGCCAPKPAAAATEPPPAAGGGCCKPKAACGSGGCC